MRTHRHDLTRFELGARLPEVLPEIVFTRARDRDDGGDVVLVAVPVRSRATAWERSSLLERAAHVVDVCRGLPPDAAGPVDTFLDEGALFLVTPGAPETSLRDFLAAGAPDTETVARLTMRLLAAVHHSHVAHLPHGGLDPRTVRVTGTGDPYVIGYGLWQLCTDPAVEIGLELGQSGYGDSGAFSGRAPTPATDLFAIGALLYYMLEGVEPFARPVALASRIDAAQASFPEGTRLGDLAPVVTALLSASPARRPTAAEVAHQIATHIPGAGDPPEVLSRAIPPAPPDPAEVLARQTAANTLTRETATTLTRETAANTVTRKTAANTLTRETAANRAGALTADPAGERARRGAATRRTRRAVLVAGVGAAAGAAAWYALGRPTPTRAAGPAPARSTPPPTPGTQLWSAAVPAGSFSPPFASGDLVIIDFGTATAVRAGDGRVLWTLAQGPLRRFTADETGAIYAFVMLAGSPALATLSPATGQVSTSIPLPEPMIQARVTGGEAYVLGSRLANDRTSTALRRLDLATGAVHWTRPGAFNIAGRMCADDTRVYVGGSGAVYAINRADGTIAWQSTAEGSAGPSTHALANGLLFTHGPRGMAALDPATGRLAWRLETPDIPFVALPNGVVGDTLFAGALGTTTISGAVRSIRADTGAVNWSATVTAGRCRVAADSGGVYAVGTDALVSLDPSDGHVRWRRPLDTPTNGGPVAARQAIVVASVTGSLIAFQTG